MIPVDEVYNEDLIVESKRLGLLIGPKGVTKIAIQEATGATINVPRAEKTPEGISVRPTPPFYPSYLLNQVLLPRLPLLQPP